MMVGTAKEVEARQLLQGQINATIVSETNIFSGSLILIIEPRIVGNTWFLSATPGSIDTIEHSTLAGNAIMTDMENGFEIDGIVWKIRATFGAKAIDHRGLYLNTGA